MSIHLDQRAIDEGGATFYYSAGTRTSHMKSSIIPIKRRNHHELGSIPDRFPTRGELSLFVWSNIWLNIKSPVNPALARSFNSQM